MSDQGSTIEVNKSTYEGLERELDALKEENKSLIEENSELSSLKEKLSETQKKLAEFSDLAGKADIATSILHNVGNVLNSVNVTTTLIKERVEKSKIANISKIAKLLRENENDLSNFLTQDPRGTKIVELMILLSDQLIDDKEFLQQEINSLLKHILHITNIISTQQSVAKVSGMEEIVDIKSIVKTAVEIYSSALESQSIQVNYDFDDLKPIVIDRDKVLQILVNLISNSKHALEASNNENKQIDISTKFVSDNRISFTIKDNGIGIENENIPLVFKQGFTTKKAGHGFGLHASLNTAKELGGSLLCSSDGPEKGCTFTLEFEVDFVDDVPPDTPPE